MGVSQKFNNDFEVLEQDLKHSNCLDRDGIFLEMAYMLDKNPNINEEIRNQFRAIFVDECQDLIDIQWHLIKKILNPNKIIFCAFGDPNQSIFKFAGSVDGNLEVIKDTDDLIFKLREAVEKKELHKWVVLVRILRESFDFFHPFVGDVKSIREKGIDFMNSALEPSLYKDSKRVKDFISNIQLLRNINSRNLHTFIKKYLWKNVFFENKKRKDEDSEWVNVFIKYLNLLQKSLNISASDLALNLNSFINPSSEIFSEIVKEKNNCLVVTTVHKAKGLEWDNVIVLEDKLAGVNKKTKEENIHIPYVAYSRAKYNLYLIPKFNK